MKNPVKVIMTLVLFTITMQSWAQAPQKFNYQAVVRDDVGAIVESQAVTFLMTIHDGSAVGTDVFHETHVTTTNAFGLVNIEIGTGTLQSGPLSGVVWGSGSKYLEVQIDLGSGYVSMGAPELISVPYALYANDGGTPGPGGVGVTSHIALWTPDSITLGASRIQEIALTDYINGYSNQTAVFSTYPIDSLQKWGISTSNYGGSNTAGTGWSYFANGGGGALGIRETTAKYSSGIHGITWSENGAPYAGVIGSNESNPIMGALSYNDSSYSYGAFGSYNADIKGYLGGPSAGAGGMLDAVHYGLLGVNLDVTASKTANSFFHAETVADGDGQSTISAFRTRSAQNDGTGYGVVSSNGSVKGMCYWGDVYSYGTGGFNYNDYNRCAGILGAEYNGSYWGALGYKTSAAATVGGYFTSTASGTGYMASASRGGIGSASYGDLMGSWSRGEVMGFTTMGELYASYNMGNEYTSGVSADIVTTSEGRTAVYSVTSNDVKVYADGMAKLQNGVAFVKFDKDFTGVISREGRPTVTVSPAGECKGLYITEVTADGFKVKESGQGASNVEFSWIAIARRVDVASKPQLPADLLDKNFDQNMKQVLFNENNTDRSGSPIWWDGSKLRFDACPEAPAMKSEEKILQFPSPFNPAGTPVNTGNNPVQRNSKGE